MTTQSASKTVNPFDQFKSLAAVSTQPENPFVELTADTLLAYFNEPSKFHTEIPDNQGRVWTYASLVANTRKGEQTFMFNVSQLNSVLNCLKGDAEWPKGVVTTDNSVKFEITQRDIVRGNQVILRMFVGLGQNAAVEI